jgi:hypothetical protein
MTNKAKIAISLIAILVVVAAGIDFYFIKKSKYEMKESKKPVPISTPKEDPVLDKDLEDQEKYLSYNFLVNFYDLYANRKSAEIFTLFTDPISLPDKNQKSLLLDGRDLDGNIGGPQLFQTSIASAYPKDFKIIKEELTEEGLLVEVEEVKNRYNSAISSVETYKVVVFLLIDQTGENYLIKEYFTANCPDKYCGFLS